MNKRNNTPKLVITNTNDPIQLSKLILNDFYKFQTENELNSCSLKQSKVNINKINTTWITEIKYTTPAIEKIQNDFEYFSTLNKEDYCQISNVKKEEDIYKVELTIHREYLLPK